MGRVREWCCGSVVGAAFMAMAVVATPVAQQQVPAPADVSGASVRGSGDGAPRLRPDESVPPAALEAFVDGVVRQAMSTAHVAGVAVAVVQDGATVFEKGYGFADLESGRRVEPETTLFRIGSITKTFTWIAWIALMRAVEEQEQRRRPQPRPDCSMCTARIDSPDGSEDAVRVDLVRTLDEELARPIRARGRPWHDASRLRGCKLDTDATGG
jgi:hypothetical protein